MHWLHLQRLPLPNLWHCHPTLRKFLLHTTFLNTQSVYEGVRKKISLSFSLPLCLSLSLFLSVSLSLSLCVCVYFAHGLQLFLYDLLLFFFAFLFQSLFAHFDSLHTLMLLVPPSLSLHILSGRKSKIRQGYQTECVTLPANPSQHSQWYSLVDKRCSTWRQFISSLQWPWWSGKEFSLLLLRGDEMRRKSNTHTHLHV